MYPQGELTELSRAKAGLRQRIACRRADCAEAATRAVRPLVWIDTAWGLWRRLAPLMKLVALPLGAVAARAAVSRPGMLRTLLRWAPPVFSAISAFHRMRRPSPAPQAAVAGNARLFPPSAGKPAALAGSLLAARKSYGAIRRT
jgi:hypothetical protein